MSQQRGPLLAMLAMLTLTIAVLRFEGRRWIAASGEVLLWVSDTFSSDNSQHILDPYSFSHMQHGLVFFFVLAALFPKSSLAWRFVASASLEAGWEILENSPFVIDRYRSGTAAVGYIGDTIINSMADIVCCSAGFLIAHYLKWKRTLALFCIVEVGMILWIKDSLLINVLMLIYPIPAIRHWQLQG